MGHTLRKKIKAIIANANNLTAVLPLKVVGMPQKNEESIEYIEEVEAPKVHLSHGLGYSSKPTNRGDGLTPIFYGYRIKGTGEEPW